MTPRLKEKYEKEIIKDLQSKFSMKNKLMVPKLVKVVLNMGLGNDGSNKVVLKNCLEDMGLISGQKPITTVRTDVTNFIARSTAGNQFTGPNKRNLLDDGLLVTGFESSVCQSAKTSSQSSVNIY